jgi:hypothetical protein
LNNFSNNFSKNFLQKQGFCLLVIFLMISFAFALSPEEAIVFVSNKNNYLLPGEDAGIQQPQVMIKNSGSNYWVVAVLKDNVVNLYVPINNELSEVETGDVSVRKLFETNIVITKITQLKSGGYGLSWPFSFTNRTIFTDFFTEFSNKSNSLIVVSTRMKEIATKDSLKLEALANDVKKGYEELSLLSKQIAEGVDGARIFEEEYLLDPDTNQTEDYKKYFEDYFSTMDLYREKYKSLELLINELDRGIAALPSTDLSLAEQQALRKNIKFPNTIGKLNGLFLDSDQLKTVIGTVFNYVPTIEGMVLNFRTRITRNNTWKTIYGPNQKINKVNSSFNSIYDSAEFILREDNVDKWIDQDAVEALKINWNQTKTRFANLDYIKALESANKSEKNILTIIDKGLTPPTDQSNDLLIQIITLLVIALIIIFAYENFYLKKKKSKEEGLNEPENYGLH